MADLNAIHKHHIVPRYKCEELGINPDFDDNFIDTTRKQHALIHWGYHCNDLSPLLEVCNPPQYVQDMIPLGDNRDVGAAQLIALGEVDGIIPLSGKDHPSYKHGRATGWRKNSKEKIAYQKEYNLKNIDKINAQHREWYAKNKEKRAALNKKYRNENKDYFREYHREYYIENKEKITAYQAAYHKERCARKKLEKATVTLDNFM